MTEIDLNKVRLPARVRLRNGDTRAFVLAKWAYALADAMMTARKGGAE